jgi:hypothetical protein
MKMTTTWAVLGTLLINLTLGLVLDAAFGVAPAARVQACAAPHLATPTKSTSAPTASTSAPPAPAPSGHGHHGYLIAVRMGWAI